jgi:hypothetical protein
MKTAKNAKNSKKNSGETPAFLGVLSALAVGIVKWT